MGVAMEGCMKYIPSVAFSSCDYNEQADLSPLTPYVQRMVSRVLAEGLPKGVCLNVNFPKGKDFLGVRLCRMTFGRWINEVDKRHHGRGYNYYWMIGEYHNDEPDADLKITLKNSSYEVVPDDMTADYSLRGAVQLPLELSKKATLQVTDFEITGDRGGPHFVHTRLDGQVHRVGLVGFQRLPAVEHRGQRQVIGTLGVEDVRAGFQVYHAFNPAFHAVEVFYQLRDFIFILILDFEKYDMANHREASFNIGLSGMTPL